MATPQQRRLLHLGRGGAVDDGVLIRDTFTDQDGTLLDGHVGERNAAWAKHPSFLTGVAAITGGRVHRSTGSPAIYLAGGVLPVADYAVSFDVVKLTDVNSSAVIFRASSSADTYYMVRYNGTGTKVELIKLLAGASSPLGEYVVALSAGVPLPVRAECAGSALRVLVSGVERIVATDTDIAGPGRVGVRLISNASATTGYHIDNLLVERLAA